MGNVGIAIAGGSCSGKTTLAEHLATRMGATLVRIDDYYRSFRHLSYDERCELNFDHPDAIDSVRLIRDVRALLSGETVLAPRYDFTQHAPYDEPVEVVPEPVVIVEGLFALCYPELVDMCELRIFVEAPEALCLERRLDRDVNERGRTRAEVIGRFASHVAPMFREFVLPSAQYATYRVSGTAPDLSDRHETIRQICATCLPSSPVP